MTKRGVPSRKKSYRRAQKSAPSKTANAQPAHRAALEHQRQGDFAAAEAAYQPLLTPSQKNADVWHAAGLLALQQDDASAAVERLERAVQLESRPALAAALAVAEAMRGDLGRFQELSQEAARRKFQDPRLYQRAAQALTRTSRWDAASCVWKAAIECRPEDANLRLEWAAAEQRAGRTQRAITVLQNIDDNHAGYFAAQNNLGVLRQESGELEVASQHYERALQRRPADPSVSYNLAIAHQDRGDWESAHDVLETALTRHPTEPALNLARATVLPTIYASPTELESVRRTLEQRVDTLAEMQPGWDPLAVRANPPFRIAYQGRNDRPVATQIGSLFGPPKASGDFLPQADRDWRTRRLRVGFISSFFRQHTVARLTRGWIAGIDRQRFETRVYSINPTVDEMSQWIGTRADSFVTLPRNATAVWKHLQGEALDVLIYPDVGMDALTTAVARTRLAPVQVAMWGHPVTSGMPTVDYFLSSDLLETDEADEHYSEQLVRLQRLPTYYYQPQIQAAASKSDWPIPESARWYLCPQSLFKLHPEFDEIIAGILAADRHAIIILLAGNQPAWQQQLRRRLSSSVPDRQLERIHFLQPQGHRDFLRLMATADVMLDPLHFGGGNTSYEAMAVGVPIVTLPSAFLRGRVTSGLYQQMNLDDTLVDSKSAYVDTAVRLANDSTANRQLRDEIRRRSHEVFEDRASLAEFERFLADAADRAATTATT